MTMFLKIGDDNFPKFNREYVSMNTSEGLRITIALVVSGIPFSGHFDKNRISFAYDADYKSAAQEDHRKGKLGGV